MLSLAWGKTGNSLTSANLTCQWPSQQREGEMCYCSFFRSDGEKCFTCIVLIYLFIMFAELFISSHLPFICLLALKSLTKCAKKFPERNPNNPLLIKYTSSKQSPSVTALTRLQRCLECRLSVTSEKCFSFSV